MTMQGGAQTITVHGRKTAVLLSMDEYRRLAGSTTSLVDLVRQSPLTEVELDLARDADIGREVEI